MTPGRFRSETLFVARVCRRLQQRGWTLREIGGVWNINRLRIYDLIRLDIPRRPKQGRAA